MGKAPDLCASPRRTSAIGRSLTILLLLAIATGVATLTLGLALRGTTDNPYIGPARRPTDRTSWRATSTAIAVPAQGTGNARSVSIRGRTARDLAPLEHASGSSPTAGPSH